MNQYIKEIGIEGFPWSFKPTTIGLRKIKEKYKLKKQEMCVIGDQLLTDIFYGKRFNVMTIYVDKLGEKDLKITKLNRVLESIIIKRYTRKDIFKRGNYYE